MLFEEFDVTDAQLLQKERCRNFACEAASRIRSSGNCLFSLLPSDELERLAAGWYDASAQAMLRGNFAAIDQWIRSQSNRAASEGFLLEDVRELLTICRGAAIEKERWDPDIFSEVEQVIQEALSATRGWAIPAATEYSDDISNNAEAQAILERPGARSGERRTFGRNRLQLPIRIWRNGQNDSGEVNQTKSISRGGLYFVTHEKYDLDQMLKVSYPFWAHPGAINHKYNAKVVRLDRLPDKTLGVALQFLDTFGSR